MIKINIEDHHEPTQFKENREKEKSLKVEIFFVDSQLIAKLETGTLTTLNSYIQYESYKHPTTYLFFTIF